MRTTHHLLFTFAVCLGLRLPTKSAHDLHSRLESEQIITILSALKYSKCLPELITMLRCRRLGFIEEYCSCIHRSPVKLREIALSFGNHPEYHADDLARNSLFGYQVLPKISDNQYDYLSGDLSRNILGPLLKLNIPELITLEAKGQLNWLSNKIYDAIDFLIYLFQFDRSVFEYDWIVESLLRIEFSLKVLLKKDPRATNIRQLYYLEWTIHEAFVNIPCITLAKIQALFCNIAHELEIETKFCGETDGDYEGSDEFAEAEAELKEDMESEIWENLAFDTPLKNLEHVVKSQRRIADKCQVQLIYMASTPSRITTDGLSSVMKRCSNGLLQHSSIIALIQVLTRNGDKEEALLVSEALIMNDLKPYDCYISVSKYLSLPTGSPAFKLVVHAHICKTRGYLSAWPSDLTLKEMRTDLSAKMVGKSDQLLASAKNNQLKVHLICELGDLVLLAVKLRIDLKSWQNFIKDSLPIGGLSTVAANLVVTMVLKLLTVLLRGAFTRHELHRALIN